ncbi:unnamed protein product, partial [marine sediment metagenome]
PKQVGAPKLPVKQVMLVTIGNFHPLPKLKTSLFVNDG